MADYDEELSEIESEVDRLTRQVSGHERVGQSTPKYMATDERQSVGFPVDSGFATARQSRGAVDDSANKLTYETDMLVEANETFLKKDKALVSRSLVQASKNVFVRVMNQSTGHSNYLSGNNCGTGQSCSRGC